MISGFLITGILLDTRDMPYRARNFYLRRTLRIFPLYYGMFLLLLLTTPLVHWPWTGLWVAWPLYLGNFLRFLGPSTGVAGSTLQLSGDAQLHPGHLKGVLLMGHFWSLCVEEQFYLVWPWVVFSVRSRRTLAWLCGAVVVLMPWARVLTQQHAPVWMLNAELLYRFTPFQLDSLLLGALLALGWRESERRRLLALGRYTFLFGSALLLVYLACLAHLLLPHALGRFSYPAWRLTWGLTLVNIYSAALTLCALRPGSIVYRCLHLRPLRSVGRISYGAYIFHDVPHIAYLVLTLRAARHFHLFHSISDRVLHGIGVMVALVSTLALA